MERDLRIHTLLGESRPVDREPKESTGAGWEHQSAGAASGRARGSRPRGGAEDAAHHLRVAEPARGLRPEVCATCGRHAVVPRTPVVLGHAPLGGNEPTLFHSMKRMVERTVVYIERAAGVVLEPARDLEPVHWSPRERLEDKHVQRAFDERERVSSR